MRRFFYGCEDQARPSYTLADISIGDTLSLPQPIIHHWCRVLRATIGDHGVLFDGYGGEHEVQLTAIGKQYATAMMVARSTEDRSAPIATMIGLVMSRGERMDYAIQKSTELGVHAIQLLSSHHGEVNLKPAQVDKKLAHWQKVAIAACEQCGLNRPPLILAPLPIDKWLEQLTTSTLPPLCTSVSALVQPLSDDTYYQRLQRPSDHRFILRAAADGQPTTPHELLCALKDASSYLQLLVGPEGGFSESEFDKAHRGGFIPWQIGHRVLRTETAPVVALASLQAYYQASVQGFLS